ncbi:15-hydroxyprostaglandin dehydrogenase [NAD(+)] isoform X1 [Leptinotarsa decemlineata]|uniref:15-hydroxyprostaglandin dehydrogenase [NAD(+)] isoform X1 n=1 Tax=Leptinotarsa decemlineata TaxID=7539 RepID=UPI003D305129
MVFEIKGKVALITGGASGLGLSHAKELLRNGLKGVTLADVNENFGKTALDEIEKEFGKERAIFVKTDVTVREDFENAFEKTVEHFKNVDILVNNAGIFNDAIWEKEIAINLNGTIHGVILGLENFLKNHKQDSEAVILNTSSIAGVAGLDLFPIYSATKFAVSGITKSWGLPFHYNRSHVRVVCICPGSTNTPIFQDDSSLLFKEYAKILPIPIETVGLSAQKYVLYYLYYHCVVIDFQT